jgi:hypothetical protein
VAREHGLRFLRRIIPDHWEFGTDGLSSGSRHYRRGDGFPATASYTHGLEKGRSVLPGRPYLETPLGLRCVVRCRGTVSLLKRISLSALKGPRALDRGVRRLEQIIGLAHDLGGSYLRGRALDDQGVESIGTMRIGHAGLLGVTVVLMIA